jgi:hypothetical protein
MTLELRCPFQDGLTPPTSLGGQSDAATLTRVAIPGTIAAWIVCNVKHYAIPCNALQRRAPVHAQRNREPPASSLNNFTQLT